MRITDDDIRQYLLSKGIIETDLESRKRYLKDHQCSGNLTPFNSPFPHPQSTSIEHTAIADAGIRTACRLSFWPAQSRL